MGRFAGGVMERRIEIQEAYFHWLARLINGGSRLDLLRFLHRVEFTYILEMDANRAADGVDLRYRFAHVCGYSPEEIHGTLDQGPCSVLEMMVALAMRCEENIMSDPNCGDRTGVWFLAMLKSLGLDRMTNGWFSERIAEAAVLRFLHREYKPNGEGGLFTVTKAGWDMRTVEIWYQMMWYLDEIVYGRRN